MKYFKKIKGELRNENSELPKDLEWDQMEEGIFAKITPSETSHSPVKRWTLGILILLIGVFTGYLANQYLQDSNSSKNFQQTSTTNVSETTHNNTSTSNANSSENLDNKLIRGSQNGTSNTYLQHTTNTQPSEITTNTPTNTQTSTVDKEILAHVDNKSASTKEEFANQNAESSKNSSNNNMFEKTLAPEIDAFDESTKSTTTQNSPFGNTLDTNNLTPQPLNNGLSTVKDFDTKDSMQSKRNRDQVGIDIRNSASNNSLNGNELSDERLINGLSTVKDFEAKDSMQSKRNRDQVGIDVKNSNNINSLDNKELPDKPLINGLSTVNNQTRNNITNTENLVRPLIADASYLSLPIHEMTVPEIVTTETKITHDKKWYIGIAFGVNSLSNHNAYKPNGEIQDFVKAKTGNQVGLDLGYKLNNHLKLNAGIAYQELYQELNREWQYQEERLIEDTIILIEHNSITGKDTEIIGDALVVDTIFRKVVDPQLFYTLNLPITLGYYNKIRNWEFGINAGVKLIYLKSYSGSYLDDEALVTYNLEDQVYQDGLHWSLMAGVETQYELGNDFYLGASISLSKQMSDWRMDQNANSKPVVYQADISFGKYF